MMNLIIFVFVFLFKILLADFVQEDQEYAIKVVSKTENGGLYLFIINRHIGLSLYYQAIWKFSNVGKNLFTFKTNKDQEMYEICKINGNEKSLLLSTSCKEKQIFRLIPTKEENNYYITLNNNNILVRYISITNNMVVISTKNKQIWKLESKKNNNLERSYSGYKIIELLGEGAFGKVYEVQALSNGEHYAMKEIKLNNDRDIQMVSQEIKLLNNLDHQHMIKLKTYFFETFHGRPEFKNDYGYPKMGTFYYLIFDLEKGLTLGKVIRNYDQFVQSSDIKRGEYNFFPESTVKFQAACLFSILDDMHNNKNIIHRDIKPDNLILKENSCLTLIDFGLAMKFDKRKPIDRTGTPNYLPPEAFSRKKQNIDVNSILYHKSVDIWSIGILLYEMLTGRVPINFLYFAAAENDKITKENYKNYIKLNLLPDSSLAKDFISKLLSLNPIDRVGGIKQAKKHPWFKNFNWKTFSERVKNQNPSNKLSMFDTLFNLPKKFMDRFNAKEKT